jgi:hypothetical protein
VARDDSENGRCGGQKPAAGQAGIFVGHSSHLL